MRFIWDEAKRESNLRKHGLDFADAYRVFEGAVVQQPTRGFIMANTVVMPWACLTPPL